MQLGLSSYMPTLYSCHMQLSTLCHASCKCTSDCCILSGSCSGSSWGALPELVASPSARARVLHCFPANPSCLAVAHQLQCPSTAGPGSRHEGCGVLLLLMWAVDFRVAHEKCWRRPSGRNAYVAPRWVTLQASHCTGMPGLSLLLLQHHGWTLSVCQTHWLVHGSAHWFWIFLGKLPCQYHTLGK